MDKSIHTPEGVRDVFSEECKKKRTLQRKIEKVFQAYGYQEIETPTFEFFDVFSREVGTTPSRELYKFFDREGNTLVLRPDITPSIARAVSKYFQEETFPMRFSYNGNVFINNSSLQGRMKESTQMGAELINDDSVDADAEMTALRADGFCDTLKNTGINLEWFVSGNFDDGGADYLESQARVDFVAALDDGSLTAAGERASEHGLHGAVVYGIAHSTQAAYYLDTGVVECLVVPDEFNVGYQSMSEIADSLEHFFHKEESREVLYTVIRRETLFSEENQEILFTMSQ